MAEEINETTQSVAAAGGPHGLCTWNGQECVSTSLVMLAELRFWSVTARDASPQVICSACAGRLHGNVL